MFTIELILRQQQMSLTSQLTQQYKAIISLKW